MELIKVNQNLSDKPKHIARLFDKYFVSSGYDAPRYIDPSTGRSGKAGMTAWNNYYWYRPHSGTAIDGGSLEVDKFFCIRVVAVDTRFSSPDGTFRVSNMGPRSEAVQVTGTNLKITWELPAFPDQGYSPDGIGGLTEGDEALERFVYASQGDTAELAALGPFTLVDTVDNNTDDATFTLESFAIGGGSSAITTAFKPPPFKMCISAFDRIWGVGGVTYTEGKALYRNDAEAETITAIAEVDPIEEVFRYTFSLAVTQDIYRGDLLTTESCDNAGNNVVKARILRVAADKTWVEIVNENGVDETPSGSPVATLEQNHIEGNADAEFTDGFEGATFGFEGEDGILIEEVDSTNNILILEKEYDGSIVKDTASDYAIISDYGLYYSAINNPHRFPVENFMITPGKSTALAAIGDRILIFSRDQVIAIHQSNLEQGYFVLENTMGCSAPFSIINAMNLVFFWTGQTFAKTDGQTVIPVTVNRASDLTRNIDQLRADYITGAYDKRRQVIRWMFPYEDEATSNYGLELNVQNEDVWPVAMRDVSLMWYAPDPDTRDWGFWHAGSSRYTDSGKSYLYQHDPDLWAGALPDDSAWLGRVTDVSELVSNKFRVESIEEDDFAFHQIDSVSTDNEGVPFVALAADDSWETHGVVKKMTDNSDGTFTVEFHADFDLDDLKPGDHFLFGCLPMSYGPRWIDFDSPRYPHHVYDLDVEIQALEAAGVLFIDWFTEMNMTPVKTESKNLTAGTSKVQFAFRMGKPYVVGFRLRWYGPRIRIQHYSLTWATIR